MRGLNHRTRCVFLLSIFVSISVSCSSVLQVKPNEPYTGSYPDQFSQIASTNPLLAKEIGKLPEMQDGISASEAKALERLAAMYAVDSDSFNTAFNQMYQVGLPEIRKYCSPLQALYWLAEDKKLRAEHMSKYSLERLLQDAWQNEIRFTDELTMDIIKGFKDVELREKYLLKAQAGIDEEIKTRVLVLCERRIPPWRLHLKISPIIVSWFG